MLSKRALKVDASGIRKVFELAAKIENPVNLSIGQPDFDVPDSIKEEAIKAIKEGFNKYTLTQGIPQLREKVGEYIKQTRALDYPANQIMISSGVSGGLLLALMSILDSGDEVVFFDPYFVMYKHLVNLLGGKPVTVDTYPDFKIDKDKLENAITDKTKAIIVNSPCNPTGTVSTDEDIRTVVEVAKKHDLLIISDEIYDGFVYDGAFHSPAQTYDKTLILGGFSKTYAMTGWRMGFVAGNEELISQMIKLQQYTFVCAPSPFQFAGLAALEMDMFHYWETYKGKRNLIYAGLKDKFDIVKPGGAFYIFPGLKQGDASQFVEKAISNDLLIIPGNVFSERNTHFRISFASDQHSLERGIEILNRVADEYYQSL